MGIGPDAAHKYDEAREELCEESHDVASPEMSAAKKALAAGDCAAANASFTAAKAGPPKP
jgi:hypothetical protein